MTDPILIAKGLGKSYITFSNNFARFASWFGFSSSPIKEFWAVKDVSFELCRGEAMALIGKNGAGKSTLLKLITGTVNATSGSIEAMGTVSSILELGLGFNPELTGRENVFLAGGLMGLGPNQISQAVKDIENFSELGIFFDQPLRVYSSGMMARLAFSLATCTTPDILIVDEVLSVGDSAFQRKCFRRIEGFLENGTALLFVSHDLESVRRLCKTALYLKNGEVHFLGNSKSSCDLYERESYDDISLRVIKSDQIYPMVIDGNQSKLPISNTSSTEYGDGSATIVDFWIEDDRGNKINAISNRATFFWCYKVFFHQSVKRPIFGMKLKSIDGVDIFSTNSKMLNQERLCINAGDQVVVRYRLIASLAPAIYFLNAGVSSIDEGNDVKFVCRKIDAMGLTINNADTELQFSGIADLNPSLNIALEISG